MTLASLLGTAYAGVSYYVYKIHWIYGSVAALLALISGFLPDVDSNSSVQMKGFTGILGVLVAVAVWEELGRFEPPLPFEFHLWATVLSYLFVRYGVRGVFARVTVHRGMNHSLPTCAIWGALTYLYYPSPHHVLRLMMAMAVMLGFLSHLVLDEICSIDLAGVRIQKSFGTAIKLWSSSIWATLLVYTLLGYLTYRVIDVWPTAEPENKPDLASSRVPVKAPKWLSEIVKARGETTDPSPSQGLKGRN